MMTIAMIAVIAHDHTAAAAAMVTAATTTTVIAVRERHARQQHAKDRRNSKCASHAYDPKPGTM
jgi:hypothetical protein